MPKIEDHLQGDRLEVHDATIKPGTRIATAGDNEGSVAPSAPLPAPPAASKPAEAKEKPAVEKRPAHRRHAKRASSNRRDRVRMARAKYVQVPGAPQVALGGGLQPNRAPPEENKVFGWVARLPERSCRPRGKAAGIICGRKEMAGKSSHSMPCPQDVMSARNCGID